MQELNRKIIMLVSHSTHHDNCHQFSSSLLCHFRKHRGNWMRDAQRMHQNCLSLRERILGIRNAILVMQKENIFYVLWLQQKCLEVKHVSWIFFWQKSPDICLAPWLQVDVSDDVDVWLKITYSHCICVWHETVTTSLAIQWKDWQKIVRHAMHPKEAKSTLT